MKKLIQSLFSLITIILLFCVNAYAEDAYLTKVYLENKLDDGIMDVFIYGSGDSEKQTFTLLPGEKYTGDLQVINTTGFTVALCREGKMVCDELLGGTMATKELVNRRFSGLKGKRDSARLTVTKDSGKIDAYFNVTQDSKNKTGEFKVILSPYTGKKKEL